MPGMISKHRRGEDHRMQYIGLGNMFSRYGGGPIYIIIIAIIAVIVLIVRRRR